MSNVGVPDEKAVILFITYLCARLMHLNKDIRVRSNERQDMVMEALIRQLLRARIA
jgi:hypothetical protein